MVDLSELRAEMDNLKKDILTKDTLLEKLNIEFQLYKESTDDAIDKLKRENTQEKLELEKQHADNLSGLSLKHTNTINSILERISTVDTVREELKNHYFKIIATISEAWFNGLAFETNKNSLDIDKLSKTISQYNTPLLSKLNEGDEKVSGLGRNLIVYMDKILEAVIRDTGITTQRLTDRINTLESALDTNFASRVENLEGVVRDHFSTVESIINKLYSLLKPIVGITEEAVEISMDISHLSGAYSPTFRSIEEKEGLITYFNIFLKNFEPSDKKYVSGSELLKLGESFFKDGVERFDLFRLTLKTVKDIISTCKIGGQSINPRAQYPISNLEPVKNALCDVLERVKSYPVKV